MTLQRGDQKACAIEACARTVRPDFSARCFPRTVPPRGLLRWTTRRCQWSETFSRIRQGRARAYTIISPLFLSSAAAADPPETDREIARGETSANAGVKSTRIARGGVGRLQPRVIRASRGRQLRAWERERRSREEMQRAARFSQGRRARAFRRKSSNIVARSG